MMLNIVHSGVYQEDSVQADSRGQLLLQLDDFHYLKLTGLVPPESSLARSSSGGGRYGRGGRLGVFGLTPFTGVAV